MEIKQDQLTERFEKEYRQLNEAQRRAVDQLDGPVMVIAGPGTGKTQILACRIAKILLEPDMQPDNILCLTYTDAGVVAMRKRLLHFIGPAAYRVGIYTFHAFCHDVIQDNLPVFEKNNLDPISDLERIQLVQKLIDGFSKNHPLKRYRGEVYYDSQNLLKLFSLMKKEGWRPDFLSERIDDYVASLPTREAYIYKKKGKGYEAGDLKENDLQAERERMHKLKAAVQEFDRFQEMMHAQNRYDFDDMIIWVIRAFEEHPSLLARYQEQYQYILVDEFQDTSGTQNKLVELLINYWEKPNVFVVGDDDQSIFRFQGANVENMLNFAQSYSDYLLTVVLTSNYRSSQPILDAAKSVIDINRERLVKQLPGLSKELIASSERVNQLTHKPRILEFETQRQEMAGLVHEVQQLLVQGIPPGKIGIIYRENKYGEEIARYCKLMDIPVYSKRHFDILKLPLGIKMLRMLKYLSQETDIPFSGDELLFELLHHDWFQIPAMAIARLSLENHQKNVSGQKSSLRGLLLQKALEPAKDLFDPGLHDGLKKASACIENLISAVPNVTLQQLCDRILQEAGVLKQILQQNDKHEQLKILTGFFDFIKDETRRKPGMNLRGLTELLETMEKEKITLPYVQVSGTDKGVNLMTAHGSKGLEYMYIFIAGSNSGFWEGKRKNNQGFKLPDNLFGTQAHTEGIDKEELRRLFYVALTRAEQHLVLSYARFGNNGKEMEASEFVAELQDSQQIPIEKIILEPELLSQFTLLGFSDDPVPEIEKMEDAVVAPVLDKFVMNVTALNQYLKCPLGFYYNQIIRVPSAKNDTLQFGSAVHDALDKYFRAMLENNNQFPPKEKLIGYFDDYMQRNREGFTQKQFKDKKEYGHQILEQYYQNRIPRAHKIVSVELNLRNVVMDGVPLKGKLDKLEFNGNTVKVVDYKTGDYEKAKTKLKGPDAKVPLGGDYWRQAVFYKLLVDHYPAKNWKVIATEFDFVEPSNKKEYIQSTIDISPEDEQVVRQQIKDTWEKIQNRDFYTGCGDEKCHWCQFVKNQSGEVPVTETEE